MTTPGNAKEDEPLGEPIQVQIYGRLLEVNLKLGTARLNTFMDPRAPLRFAPPMAKQMRLLENKYVKVQGRGWINDSDTGWVAILVEEIARREDKPFDIDEFHKDPGPNIFDPDTIVRSPDKFDVDEYLRVIYESRRRPPP